MGNILSDNEKNTRYITLSVNFMYIEKFKSKFASVVNAINIAVRLRQHTTHFLCPRVRKC
jgi:hypothetical protein